MRKFLYVLIVMVFGCAVSHGAESNEKTVTFGAHFTSTGGQSSSQEFDFTNTLIEVIDKEIDLKIVTKKYPSNAAVQEAFLADEIDAALFWAGYIVEIEAAGTDVIPWVTIGVDDSRKVSECLWMKKSESGPKDISTISGGVLLAHDYNNFWLIGLREYLFTKGIDKPLWQQFDSFLRVNNMNSAFMALAVGNADFYWVSRDDTFLKLLSPNLLNQVAPVYCTEPVYARSAVVINRKTVSDEVMNELRAGLKIYLTDKTRLEKQYPRLKAFNQYMKMAKIKLIPAREDEFKAETELYRKAEKNGWLGEAKYIVKKWDAAAVGKPVRIKPDFNICRDQCSLETDAGKREICIEKCME